MPNQKTLILFTMLIPSLVFNLHFEGQRYEVVFPRKLLYVYKDNTDIQSIYPDLAHYELQLNGHRRVIRIEKSVGLFADNYTESHYKEDGTLVTSSPRYQDHCHYQGYIMDKNNSNVVLSTCKGLSGIIQIREKIFFIEPLKMTDTEAHAVYEAEDTLNHTCGVSNISLPPEKPTFKSLNPTDAEKLYLWNAKKYVELFLVADNSMFTKYGSSIEMVKSRLFEIVNYMNKVYKSINIYLALIGVEIWDSGNQIQVVPNVDNLLNGFKDWRINTLLPRKYHDNAQLLTNVDFEGDTIGYAPVSAMCGPQSISINQDAFQAAAGVGATMSHEMGHNLGMGHDQRECICPDKSCIMFPSVGPHFPLKFSSCSMRELRNFIYNNYPSCLLNVPTSSEVQTPSVCGNMFTETGEECDCGLPEECNNKCCDPHTCKLKPGSECSEGPCCRKCKFKHAGALCRPAKDDCDLPDLCDGKSPTCKKDSFRVNGYPCRNGVGACFNGACPTISGQCSDLWGGAATAAPNHCYEVNTRGIENGHCKQEGEKYIACEKKDKMCGLLYCIGGEKFPRANGDVFIMGNCKTIVYKHGITQAGTKCSATDVCFEGKCSNIEETYKTKGCEAKCPGHSVCDHDLECQCEPGWAPPNCDISVPLNQAIEEVSSLWWWLSVLWILALNI